MKYQDLQQEIQKCKPYLLQKWSVQNNEQDRETNFIYYCKSLESCKLLAKENNVNEIYAIHRWYNFVCSKATEEIMCELGATPYENPKNHEIDLFLKDTNFDIKVCKFVLKVEQDLYSRQSKNDMIIWLMDKQSKEGRVHNDNKLYIVCVATTEEKAIMLKSDFQKIRSSCERFVEFYKDKPFNQVAFGGKKLFADLIYVKE